MKLLLSPKNFLRTCHSAILRSFADDKQSKSAISRRHFIKPNYMCYTFAKFRSRIHIKRGISSVKSSIFKQLSPSLSTVILPNSFLRFNFWNTLLFFPTVCSENFTSFSQVKKTQKAQVPPVVELHLNHETHVCP